MSDSTIQEPIKKKSYKKAPLMPIHIRIFVAIILGQIACGFALGISGTALSNAVQYINISDFCTGLIGAGALIGLAGSVNWSTSHANDQYVYISTIFDFKFTYQ